MKKFTDLNSSVFASAAAENVMEMPSAEATPAMVGVFEFHPLMKEKLASGQDNEEGNNTDKHP